VESVASGKGALAVFFGALAAVGLKLAFVTGVRMAR
jgi:hypothetical protein